MKKQTKYLIIILLIGILLISGCSETGNIIKENELETETIECIEKWQCNKWGECLTGGIQIRECFDENDCGTIENRSPTSQKCEIEEQEEVILPPSQPILDSCVLLGCPKGTEFVGSKKSDKYHFCDCVWAKKIYKENLICFKSKEDAQSQGYVACKVCHPPS